MMQTIGLALKSASTSEETLYYNMNISWMLFVR